jgi:hypothetical protein
MRRLSYPQRHNKFARTTDRKKHGAVCVQGAGAKGTCRAYSLPQLRVRYVPDLPPQ